MKKYRLKLSSIEFRFLQSILLRLAEAYKHQFPEKISHQLLIELYEGKFNISVVDQNLQKVFILNRSIVMALHSFLNEVPLSGEADRIRNKLFNEIDTFLQA